MCTAPKSTTVGECGESSIGRPAPPSNRRPPWMTYPSPLRLSTSGRVLFRTDTSTLKLKRCSSVGLKEISSGSDEFGPTVPLSGDTSTIDSDRGPPVAKEERSTTKAKGMCSVLTMLTTSRAVWPSSLGPKLCLVRSSVTFGSAIEPASKKGTSILSEGMRKRQKLSAVSADSGVNSKTISYFRPGCTIPLRVLQRNGRWPSTSAPPRSSCSLSHKNSYGTLVGLTMKKRRVLRTRVPSDSNSIVRVDGSRGAREPSGPGISGERRPDER
mmetsp:Transcript_39787/g.118059  ORF Transcript_39787/g.118059 Transcript_39787/m.118059 type:complete len:270 (-) Transcript_39787:6195-7004(-)